MAQRVYLASLAIGPALAVLVVPLPALGLAETLLLGGLGGVYALVAAFSLKKQRRKRTSASLLSVPHSALPCDLPPFPALHDRLMRSLYPLPEGPQVPPGRDDAIAAILNRFLTGWNHAGADMLTPQETLELALLDRLLRASPQEAGALAQLFTRPDLMLALRDEVQAVAHARAIHDRDRHAFEATLRLWLRQLTGTAPTDLAEALKGLGAEDPDLWHHVVLTHDRTDPAQRAAALWCIEQPGCDRATIAVYMADPATSDALRRAIETGETGYPNRVRAVIDALNDGRYPDAALALDPVDAVAHAAPGFAAMLTALAEQAGDRRWPDPCGLFTAYPGRAPRNRAHWDLSTGRLRAAPLRDDYIDMDRVPA